MRDISQIDTILRARKPEKILQSAHDLDPQLILWLGQTDKVKFDKFIEKVGSTIKKNKKLTRKIQGKGETKNA